MVVVRPVRVAINTKLIYPQVVSWQAAEQEPALYVQLREGKSYIEIFPAEVRPGWKTKYDFRLEGGLFYLLTGMLALGLGASPRYFGYITASQVVLGGLSYGFLFAAFHGVPELISGSNLIGKYLSPAVCVMLLMLPFLEDER